MDHQKNDIVTIRIDDIGSGGEGIGKTDGYTLFVKDAVIGDTVEAKITKVKKNYGYARTEKVITPSPFRVTPRCSFYRQCGGCQIQAMSYEKQLIFKQNKINNDFMHIGGFSKEFMDSVTEPIIGMEIPWHYRNKAQYPIGYDKNGNLVTGFYAGRTHDIIPNTDCALGASENKLILETILSFMKENNITAYKEKTGEGLVRHVLIRSGFFSGEIMVCLVINGTKLPAADRLADRLINLDFDELEENSREDGGEYICEREGKGFRRKVEDEICIEGREYICGREGKNFSGEVEDGIRIEGEEYICRKEGKDFRRETIGYIRERNNNKKYSKKRISSICVNINMKRTNVIMGEKVDIIWGRSYIEDSLRIMDITHQPDGTKIFSPTNEKVNFHISPLSFYQVNPLQTEKLYSIALEYAGLTGNEIVWDLYCGIGTITLFLARAAKYVYGVEVVPQAIEDAKENARINGIKNVEFYTGEAEEIFPEKFVKEKLHADVVVVDPPRKGCDIKCLETMLAMKPERIVYVSCDPATLSRDVRILTDGGYEVRKVNGVDQFGQGVHVETVVLMSRVGVEYA